MSDAPSDEPESPAERRLLEHLELVRLDSPASDASLTERILRRARWQTAARHPLEVLGAIASAVTGAIALLIGGGRSTR